MIFVSFLKLASCALSTNNASNLTFRMIRNALSPSLNQQPLACGTHNIQVSAQYSF